MINILVSVRQPFSVKFCPGKRVGTAEECAAHPRGEHVTLWLYESGKDGERAVIGKCWMVSYVRMRHMSFRCRPDDFIEDFCVTGQHLLDYMPCYAWESRTP